MTLSDLPSAAGLAVILRLPEDEVRRLSLAAKLRKTLLAKGLCPDCAGQPVPRRVKCRSCLDADAAKVRARKMRLIANGCCRRCTRPAVPGKTQCDYHLTMYKKNSRRHRS